MLKTTGLKIGIIGYGVVGSATAHRLYDLGNEIYVHDIRPPEKLNYWKEDFKFRPVYNLNETDATFLILPTPSNEDKLYRDMPWDQRRRLAEGNFAHSLDKSAYDSVTENLGKGLRSKDNYHLFIVRSTVEPGTTRGIGMKLQEISGKNMGRDYSMGMIPEFLRAFNNLEDEVSLPKLIAGHHDQKGLDLIQKIYQNLQPDETGRSKIYPMTLEEAELIKMEHNALNATWIALNNARQQFYELLGEKGIQIDYKKMTNVLTTMTESFTNPKYGTKAGVPFGGTCLKKDPGALHSWAEDEMRVSCHFTRFIELALHQNLHMQKRIFNDHLIPQTTEQSLEELASRNHETYDNIKKVQQAIQDIKSKG